MTVSVSVDAFSPYEQLGRNPPGELIETGYFVERNVLDDVFFLYEITGYVFKPLKNISPYQIQFSDKNQFEGLIAPLETYIDEQKKGAMVQCDSNPLNCTATFEALNGISERELATEIVKASYCFGTDPFVVASKIRQESRFDMASVSQTGALGLTQLTTPGIKEILDQMGNRGERYAFIENKEYLASAFMCYLENEDRKIVLDLPKIATYETNSGSREYKSETMQNMYNWILPSRQHSKITNKKIYIQRQIILGQALLKIYLAYSKKLLPRQTTLRHYDEALKMFNGDNIRVQYAKEVIRNSKPGQGF